MTVTTTSTKVQYNGDGSTTAFSVPFKYLDKDDVKVILTDADGDDTEWTRGTQYTLSAAGVDAGGTLTVSTSPTNYTPQAGERLTILLDAEATQNVDLPLGGPFPSTSVETALDRLTLLVQQREEENARSLRFPESDPTTIDGTIPSSANRANMVLGFNGDGEPTVYTTNVETVTASSTNYDNATSGLTAINVQDAIDELADEKFDKAGGAVSGDTEFSGSVTFSSTVAGVIPPGCVAWFAMDSAPSGWLKCNGAAVSRTTYADLFAAIGTTFGAGDGSTTFNLPDLRGEFLRGWDDGRGVDSGRTFGTSQNDALQNITGSSGAAMYQGNNIGSPQTDVNGAFAYSTGTDDAWGSGTGTIRGINFDASRVARTAHETRPRNIALLACIKY